MAVVIIENDNSTEKSAQEIIESAFTDEEIQLYNSGIEELLSYENSNALREYKKTKYSNEVMECARVKLDNKTLVYSSKYRTWQFNGSERYEKLLSIMSDMVKRNIPLMSSMITLYEGQIKKDVEQNKLIAICNKLNKKYENIINSNNAVKEKFMSNLSEETVETYSKLIEAEQYVAPTDKSKGILETVADKLYKRYYVVRNGENERLATKTEVKKMLAGVIERKELLISEEHEKFIYTVCYLFTGKETYSKRAKLYKNFTENMELFNKAINYITSEEFTVTDKDKILDGNKLVQYLDDDEVETIKTDSDIKIETMLKLIKQECDPDYGSNYSKLAWKIAFDALKKKKYNLSEKQYKVIEDNYNNIIKKNLNNEKFNSDKYKPTQDFGVRENTVNNIYTQELEDKAQQLKKYISSMKDSANSYMKMGLSISNGIIKNKRCTEKQANVINSLYSSLIENNRKRQCEDIIQTDVAGIGASLVENENSTNPLNDDVTDSNTLPDFLSGMNSIFGDSELKI